MLPTLVGLPAPVIDPATPEKATSMDWLTFTSNVLTFISSLVGSLAWPAVAVGVLVLLRPHLATLMARLEELSLPGGATAKFNKELHKAQKIAEEIRETEQDKVSPPASDTQDSVRDAEAPTPDSEGQSAQRPASTSHSHEIAVDPYLELAVNFPAAAILQSYSEVIAMLARFPDTFKDIRDKSKFQNAFMVERAVLEQLISEGWLDSEIMPLYHRIRHLRNVAAHALKPNQITTSEAIDYRELCLFIIDRLKTAYTGRMSVQHQRKSEV